METATIQVVASVWNVEEMTGYKPITTFWNDFSIADHFGVEGVKDTYKRAFAGWKDNYKFLTELVMVLNHKIWQWYERNDELARAYNDLWEEVDLYAQGSLKGEALEYFYDVTD